MDDGWEQEIARRKARRLRDQAAVEARGWKIDHNRGERVFRYRERGLLTARRAPIPAMEGEIFHLPFDVAVDADEAGFVVRPWAMWPAEDELWKPRFEVQLEERRERIVERICARLRCLGKAVRVEAELPDEGRPMRIPTVDMTAMRTLLEFLLRSGLTLQGDTWQGHPNALFVGSKARRKWYATQGGEMNVDPSGEIPVDRLLASFVLPDRPGEGVDVTPRRIEGAGPAVWEAFIWAHPRRGAR